MNRGILAAALLALATGSAFARDPAVVRAFRATHPCPATGLVTGACDNYIVDHMVSLCLGGPDTPNNMTWQTKKDAAKKDILEKQLCAWVRKERKERPPP